MSHVCYANGCRFTSRLGALRFCNSDCLHISIHRTSFSLLFSKLSKLALRVRLSISVGLGYRQVRVRVKVRFQVYFLRLLYFYQAYCILLVCYCHVIGGRQTRFQIFMEPVFLHFFQKFLNFRIQIYALSLWFTFGV